MWVSAFLAIVSHLTPKGPKKEEEVASTRSKEYYKVNDQVKRNIMNAIRIDEQKRLETLKRQSTIQSRGLSTLQHDRKVTIPGNQNWQPLTQQTQRMGTIKGGNTFDTSFNLIDNQAA
jgi:hypothetical protein